MENYTEKQKIFDEYAKMLGFSNWLHFISSSLVDSEDLCSHTYEACDLVQKEQQKRIVENIKLHIVEVDRYGDEFVIEKCDSSGFPLMYADLYNGDANVAVEENSILSENNLIK